MSATLIAAPAEMWARIPVALLPRHSVVLSEELELPTVPGPWRFKLDGPERASPWVDATLTPTGASLKGAGPSEVRIEYAEAEAGTMQAWLSEADEPAAGAMLRLATEADFGPPSILARYEADAEGAFEMGWLVGDQQVVAIVSHPDAEPLVRRTTTDRLNGRRALSPGAELRGRVVDGSGIGRSGSSVVVDALLPGGLAMPLRSGAHADADGR